MQKSNLLSSIIKEDYESYYINSGVNLSLVERSFIDSAIEKLTDGAKSLGKTAVDKTYGKIRSLAPTKKGKRLRLSNKYQKEFKKNDEEIEDLSYDLAELEDNLQDMSSDSTQFTRTENQIKAKTAKFRELKTRNDKLAKFIITQPVIFGKDSDRGNTKVDYESKSDPVLTKLRNEYLNLTLKHSTALAKLPADHNTVKDLENKKKKAEQKLYDRGYPRMDENIEYVYDKNILIEGWKERFSFNTKDYKSSFGQSLSNANRKFLEIQRADEKNIPKDDSKNLNYDKIFAELKNQKKLMPTYNNKMLKNIGEFILKNKKEIEKFNIVKEVYNELETIQKNIISQERISLDNKKLNPAALYQVHLLFNKYSKSLVLLSNLVEENPDLFKKQINTDIPNLILGVVGQQTAALTTGTKSMASKDSLINAVSEISNLYYYLETVHKKVIENKDSIINKNPLNGNEIKKYDESIVKLYNYIHETTHETFDKLPKNHIKIEDEEKEKDNNVSKKDSEEDIRKKKKKYDIELEKKKKEIITKWNKNLVAELEGEDDPEKIKNKIENYVDKNLAVLNKKLAQSSNEEVVKDESVKIVEAFAHVRWRRNPRTGLDKVVMTCKSDEYKKPLNREISVAGKKVKEVMCLPKSTKPAKQKEKDRKSSLKRWRKIKSNPGKMRRMFVKRKMTKARSKTLR